MPSKPKPLHTAMPRFEPTVQAARLCLEAVRPDDYARSRNALDGAVTRLSPYLTHGLLSLTEVYSTVHARRALHPKHKLVFELGWRAYYRHVWAHLGDGIGQSLHAGLLPDSAYQPDIPPDVLQARTGIPAIDLAVRELYETGYLHNHARMWLASYLVHLRKVHWHAGAQWMLGHLLDGDRASNHLSWQWVAGTGSSKPYLFNAENIAKYAPAHWHSPGTAIDVSYETMNALARSTEPVYWPQNARHASTGLTPPTLYVSPLAGNLGGDSGACPGGGPGGTWRAPDALCARHLAGRHVWLHHPWSLATGCTTLPADVLHIGVGFDTCHSASPWSQHRWDFVTRGLAAQAAPMLPLWWGSVRQIAQALQNAVSVRWQPDPHVDEALSHLQTLLTKANPQRAVGPRAQSCLFEPVSTYCRSFSEWWKHTRLSATSAPMPH
jgi:deoxyribodipyrimidine photo-lyase